MNIFILLLSVLGLTLFEVINSIDNAVINAEVLTNISAKARKWFLSWGIIIAVFIIRGLLPILIFWMSNPKLTIIQAFTAMFSSDPALIKSIEESAPPLLIGAGLFLLLLFLHWLFMEEKNYGLRTERFFHRQGIWFYAVASVVLLVIIWASVKVHPALAIGAAIGTVAFFITSGFKENAEQAEKKMLDKKSGMSDISKLIYLEVIDASFSVDGVLGAFAFTLFVPLILIGNGIGAIVVRQITVRNIETVKKYKYLKNGAMYSILFLGLIMIADGFGSRIPQWISPVATFVIIGFFLWKSIRDLKREEAEKKSVTGKKKRK